MRRGGELLKRRIEIVRKVDCEEVLRLIHAFEDNELDAVKSLEIQDHFEGCASCRGERVWQEEASRSLERIRKKTPAAGPSLRNRMHEIAGGGAIGFPRHLRKPSAWSAAAALIALFLIGFLFYPPAELSGWDARSFVQSHRMPVLERAEAGIETDDPEAAADWLNERLAGVSVPTELPRGYRLVGAGIAEIEESRNGVLFYESE